MKVTSCWGILKIQLIVATDQIDYFFMAQITVILRKSFTRQLTNDLFPTNTISTRYFFLQLFFSSLFNILEGTILLTFGETHLKTKAQDLGYTDRNAFIL